MLTSVYRFGGVQYMNYHSNTFTNSALAISSSGDQMGYTTTTLKEFGPCPMRTYKARLVNSAVY